MWTSNPVADAERFYTETPQQAARAEAEEQIREAFKAYFGGALGTEVRCVGYLRGSTYLLERSEAIGDIVADLVSSDSECENEFERLMVGQSTVERLREVIVDRYVEREADDLAELLMQQAGEVDE